MEGNSSNIVHLKQNLISILYRFVPAAQCKTILASFNFHLRKLACFATFERKWACLIVKKLKNCKFETYWLTLCTLYGSIHYTVIHIYFGQWIRTTHTRVIFFWVCYHSSFGLKYTYRVTKCLQIYGWTVLLLVGVKTITQMF